MSKNMDAQIMTAIVAGGIGAVAGALFAINKAKAATLNGVGAVIRFQPQAQMRGLAGWGGWGTPGFGRTGAAVYWRKVAPGGSFNLRGY